MKRNQSTPLERLSLSGLRLGLALGVAGVFASSGFGASKDTYYVNDHLASTLATADAAGEIAQIEADAFGTQTGAVAKDSRFTGKPYDADMGAYVFPFRNYRSDEARWMSADPSGFPDGVNSSAYSPSPTSQLDTLGLMITYNGVEYTGKRKAIGAWQLSGFGPGSDTMKTDAGLVVYSFTWTWSLAASTQYNKSRDHSVANASGTLGVDGSYSNSTIGDFLGIVPLPIEQVNPPISAFNLGKIIIDKLNDVFTENVISEPLQGMLATFALTQFDSNAAQRVANALARSMPKGGVNFLVHSLFV